MVITPPAVNAQVGDDVAVESEGESYTGTIQKRTLYPNWVDFNCVCVINGVEQSGHVTVYL